MADRKKPQSPNLTVYEPSRFWALSNLPEQRDGTLVIVSQLSALAVAAMHEDRTDVVYPAARLKDGARHDQNGLIAVRALIRAT